MPTCSTVLGSSVGEYLSGQLRLSLSVKSLAMKTVAELSTFLVIGAYNGSARLEYGWLHLELLKPDCWPRMDQLTMAVLDLSRGALDSWVMRWFVISHSDWLLMIGY